MGLFCGADMSLHAFLKIKLYCTSHAWVELMLLPKNLD